MKIEAVNFEDAFGFMCDAVRDAAQNPQYAEIIIDMYGEQLEQESFQIEVPES
jgi:hypothetical protein